MAQIVKDLFICIECGIFSPDDYMVFDSVWLQAVDTSDDGFLHLSCLEKRLGRNLTYDDFTGAPLNMGIGKRHPQIRQGDKEALQKRLAGDFFEPGQPGYQKLGAADIVDEE